MSTLTPDGAVRTPGTRGPQGPGGPWSRRRLALPGLAVVVVAALVTAFLVLTGGDGGADADQGAAEPAASDPARNTSVVPYPPTPAPTGPTEDVSQLPSALPEVALDAPAAVGNGVVATLPVVEGIEGTATGPGNVAGPAVRVTVRIENGTAEAISLAGVAVNTYYGADRTPASPLDDPSQRAFGGTLEPGGSADGVYVFTVPADARDSVTVEVGYQAGAPLLLFTGPVG